MHIGINYHTVHNLMSSYLFYFNQAHKSNADTIYENKSVLKVNSDLHHKNDTQHPIKSTLAHYIMYKQVEFNQDSKLLKIMEYIAAGLYE